MKNKLNLIPKFLGLTTLLLVNLFVTSAFAGEKSPTVKIQKVVQLDGAYTFKIVVIVKHDDADQVANVKTEITATDKGPSPVSKEVKLSLDKTKDQKDVYSGEIKFDKSPIGFTYEITAIMLDKSGNTYKNWESSTEKVTLEQDCKTNFRLDNKVQISITNSNGLYAIKFNFGFKDSSDIPNTVKMVVKFENCKGETVNITIPLKFDSKTGEYYGSESISQSKDCPWKLVYGEIGAYNLCNDKTAWSFEVKESKSNGSGTRHTSSTSTQTQQTQLL